ncbi:hypothetical protein Lal_00048161 [Lupinus albus]|uniref:Putative gibberellin 2-beta-dioxygenase n=1 Tax=Lupinus albus TaxID=3870 RepID=A0A6A5MDX7_LUPAL|nr:putative gibberellin 2-beta-dioxygenase [Lupinus albus]KAF1868882.1 hypothetical protein Lal_00048161 [Lupinus albus]
MASSSSSAQNQQHQSFPNLYGSATSAPPPTPSNNLNNDNNMFSPSAAADTLSHILNRLPPSLSLPTKRRSSPTITFPPSFSLSLSSNEVLSTVSNLGFAQLTDHSLPSELANSAESEALALFELSRTQKESLLAKNNWPFGYEPGDDEDGENRVKDSFRFDSSCTTESTDLELTYLREFARALEKLGLKIIDSLTDAMGLENPVGYDPTRLRSIMWVSECVDQPGNLCGSYPFIVGLQYQLRSQKYSLLSDSGWVSVLPHVDSILVTVGDIAQVWSNGKLKKVRGKPMCMVGDENDTHYITMSLLITLPIESNVVPLLPKATIGNINIKDQKEKDEEEEEGNNGDNEELENVFNSFDFEDYAWRVYNERLYLKDPLDRYRVT